MATGADPIVDIDRLTGELIQGWARCKQSILVILSTRLRTRVMRRWFGSDFMDLQDKPGNDQVFAASLGQAIVAINTYEPEFRVSQVSIQGPITNGEVTITVVGTYLPESTAKKVSVTL